MTISPYSRIGSLEALLRIPFVSEVDMDKIMEKEVSPHFVPPVSTGNILLINLLEMIKALSFKCSIQKIGAEPA